MISVIFPTRGRPDSLLAAIASLLGRAADQSRVEILVMADPDEAGLLLPLVRDFPQARGFSAPERYGYGRLHEYYNALAARARGDWLLLWNDDARMQSAGWDAVIEAQEPAVLWTTANHSPHANIFPAWPRAWAQVTGHVSASPHCDSWLQVLGDLLGRQRKVPVEVFHDRKDVTGGHDDATYAEGRGRIGTDGYWPGGEPRIPEIAGDALLVRQHLGWT